ncbi:Pirin-domain-containing protein [Ceraceosorus guamensis]|uniref:Pirin-domain-containing protein n=1 Tax=Ceraceosorus guamensis TaxID=1522189 RepID=A0A316W0S8_9BASI|nr:Pirin-domain-containing protein [Ceraceosorus guamensis]PWN42151.1 Pirin-domain-containing protein [Ceraceosorus guamensis]
MSILQPRRWHERGSADHGWLKTFHTFSFANYYDARFEDFGPLRVLNEDRVAPKTGFPTHAHNNAEIFSYIISGQLTHRDSMGNVEVLKRGEVQFTSAGSGIRHSEYNDHANEEVHFLQIWYTPDERNLTPKYYSTPHIDDVEKRNRFLTLIKPACTFSAQELSQIGLLPAGRAIPAHCSLSTSVSLLSAGASVKYAIGSQTESKAGSERWIYIHLAMTSGWKEPRLHAQHIRKYVVPNQPHQTRLEHAAQFLRGVYARTASWASYPAPSNRSYRPTRKALSSRAKRPRVTLTFAQSIDGYIAGEGKEQVALSSSESFVMTHAWVRNV